MKTKISEIQEEDLKLLQAGLSYVSRMICHGAINHTMDINLESKLTLLFETLSKLVIQSCTLDPVTADANSLEFMLWAEKMSLFQSCAMNFLSFKENDNAIGLMSPDVLLSIRFQHLFSNYLSNDENLKCLLNWSKVEYRILSAHMGYYISMYYDATEYNKQFSSPEEHKKYESSLTDQNPYVRFMYAVQRNKYPISHGVGACMIQAELLLMWLLMDERTATRSISMVQFYNKDNRKLEEINGVILGEWPKPGCLIICPWLRHKKIFVWQGSLENTPEVQKINQYNTTNEIFRVLPDEKFILLPENSESNAMLYTIALDRSTCQGVLKKARFTEWLTSEFRKQRLGIVNKVTAGIIQLEARQLLMPPKTLTAIKKF